MSDESEFIPFQATYQLGKTLGRKEERAEVIQDLNKLRVKRGYVIGSYEHGVDAGIEKSIEAVQKRDEENGS